MVRHTLQQRLNSECVKTTGKRCGCLACEHCLAKQARVPDLSVQKQDRALGLILSRCGDASFDREMRQKRLDLRRTQITQMTLVKMNPKRLIQSTYAC